VFAFQDRDGSAEVAFTDRHRTAGGGPSRRARPLDLASHDGELAEQARADLRTVTEALTRPPAAPDGPPVPYRTVLMRQVHGAEVAVVDERLLSRLPSGPPPVADALVTDVPGVVLVTRAADCVPVLLADAAAGVVAAVHCGRRGLTAGVVPRAVESMQRLGAATLRAWVGPHVCGGCYEVPEEMRAQVAAQVPEAEAVTTWGTPSLDLGAGVRAQLRSAGAGFVEVSRCTVEDDDLFSYRRQGAEAGRLAGLVWMRP
jgi:purine-nucleoside/S-methyl-5'-thioadenosine phosphorylase / adenosine deaminase